MTFHWPSSDQQLDRRCVCRKASQVSDEEPLGKIRSMPDTLYHFLIEFNPPHSHPTRRSDGPTTHTTYTTHATHATHPTHSADAQTTTRARTDRRPSQRTLHGSQSHPVSLFSHTARHHTSQRVSCAKPLWLVFRSADSRHLASLAANATPCQPNRLGVALAGLGRHRSRLRARRRCLRPQAGAHRVAPAPGQQRVWRPHRGAG